MDISVDPVNKMLMLLCSIPEKIMYFTYSGDFIREENNNLFYGEFAIDSNFIYHEKTSHRNMQRSSFQIDIKNISNDTMRSELPYVEKINNDAYNNGIAVTKGKSAIHYVRRYDFNIYQFVDGHVVSKYFVDFGKYAVPDDLKEQEENVLSYCSYTKRIFSMTCVVDNGHFLIFYTDQAVFFYDKKTDILTGYRKFKFSKAMEIELSYQPYLPIANTDKIAYSIEAAEFATYYKLPDGSSFPEGLDRDSNPVLLIYELK
jgi:hypothetical protein